MEPSAWPANLPSKLYEWDVKWSEHQGPFCLGKKRLCCSDVLGIAVMGSDRNGFLFPTAICEFLCEGFEHEGFHHRAAIAENVSAKGVNHFVSVCPSDCSVDCGFRDTVSSVINERLPSHFTAGWNSFYSLTER
jgi:hypothetical protein